MLSAAWITLALLLGPSAGKIELDNCDPERIKPPAQRQPLPANTTAPTDADPLGGFLPGLPPVVGGEVQRVPITELPEGAPHSLVVNSLVGIDRLRRLELQRTGLNSLEPLATLESVEVLVAYDTAVDDLTSLTHLTMLRELDLRSTRVSDPAPLKSMLRLRLLALDDTPVANVRTLASLRCLEVLTLGETAIKSLRGLGKLKHLRHLNVQRTEIANIAPLAGASDLRELDLSYTQVTDLRPLLRLANLHKLVLRGTEVSDVRVLGRMPQLEEIDLRETNVTLESLDALIDALPFTTIHTHAYREEIKRLEALQSKTQAAMTEFNRAESLWGEADRQMEALELGRQSLIELESVGRFAEGERAAVAAWLAQHRAK